jgi:hypothetical protein
MTTNLDSDLAGLLITLRDTMRRIDVALDRRDKRAFQAWSTKWVSLSARGGTMLAGLVAPEA